MSEAGDLPQPKEDVVREVEISGQQLVDIFNSPRFRVAINQSVGITRKSKSGDEAGFTFYYNPELNDSTVVYSTETGAGTLGIGEKASLKDKGLLDKGYIPIIHAHTHPLSERPGAGIYAYMPSPDDILHLQLFRRADKEINGVDGPRLGVIIVNKGVNNTELVLFQETDRPLDFHKDLIFGQYDRDLSTNETFRDIFDLLENYGLKGALINYPSKGLTGTAEEKVKIFGSKFKTNIPEINIIV